MSTIALPSWFDVAECEAQLVPEVRGFPGPYGGPTEVLDLLGDRWQFRLTLPDGNHGQGAQSEVLFNRLHGGADWLRLHHFARPAPRGTARGSIVLSSAMAQGANTMQVGGCVNANLLLQSGFELDTNGDGLADGLTVDSGVVTAYSRGVGNSSPYMQQIVAGALPSGGLAGMHFISHALGDFSGRPITVAFDVNGAGASGVHVAVQWFDTAITFIAQTAVSLSMPSSWSRRSNTFTAPAGAARAQLNLYLYDGTGGLAYGNFDNVQLEIGAAATPYAGPATLLAGDMLGHNGEQLFQVAENATANDAGAIELILVNRARKAIASGQAIVWDKPQLPFQLLSPGGVPTAYTRGRARGQQVDFVEAWA